MDNVIKILEAPHLEFATKGEVYDFLAKHEKRIIEKKKGVFHESAHKFLPDVCLNFNKHLLVNKLDAEKMPFQVEQNKFYPIINTTNVVDSHRDVHLKGIWNKSAKEQNRKTYYVFDHELKSLSIIVKAKDVEIKVIPTTFRALGYPMDGDTEALTFVFDEDKIIHDRGKEFLEDSEMQNSIRMRYLDVRLCMNSENVEHKQYKENYNNYKSEVANVDDLGELEYFYAVKEAAIVNEGSLLPFGSNKYTPIVYFKEAAKSTSDTNKTEPPQGTQIEWEKVIKNF